jgi:type II secretory pathway component PulF
MQFAYTAKANDGEIVSGMIDATSVSDAQKRLREHELFPVVVRRNSAARGLLNTLKKRRGLVPQRELLSLTTQLAIMTRSGIDLAGAIKTLSRQCTHKALKQTMEEVHRDVTGGKSVSESLRKHSHIFGAAYVASVAAGEASGELPEVLTRLSQLQRADLRNRSAIRTLLAYPLVLSCVSLLVIIALVCFVLPQFAGIFAEFEVPLPVLTQVLIAISTELRRRAWLWGPVAVLMVVGLVVARNTPSGRRRWDRLLLNMAIVRNVTRAVTLGRTFRMLGLMIESGVPLLEGLRLTRRSVSNSLYRDLFDRLEEDILNGRGLATSLVTSGFIPPAAAELELTAEKTGTLGMVTQLMGEHYEEEGEARLRELATILEPLIIVVMGAVVAAVVASVMLPMFEIATLAG